MATPLSLRLTRNHDFIFFPGYDANPPSFLINFIAWNSSSSDNHRTVAVLSEHLIHVFYFFFFINFIKRVCTFSLRILCWESASIRRQFIQHEAVVSLYSRALIYNHELGTSLLIRAQRMNYIMASTDDNNVILLLIIS